MMKRLLIISILLYTCLFSSAQNSIKSEKFGISFTSTEDLKSYETESDSILGYESDNYSVDIEIISIDDQSGDFIQDLKYGVREIASDLGLSNIRNGQKISGIEKSYYVLADGLQKEGIIPTFVIAILNFNKNLAYEITIDCYNSNIIEGKEIANSFKLIE